MNILYKNKNFILMMNDDRKKRISVNQISKPINDKDINEEIDKYRKLIKTNTNRTEGIVNGITFISNEKTYDVNQKLYNASIKAIDDNITKHEKLINDIKENSIIPNIKVNPYSNNEDEIRIKTNPKQDLIEEIQNDLAKLSDIKKQLDQTFLNITNTAIPKIKNDILYSTTQESSSLIKRAVGAKASFLKDLGNLLDKTTKKLANDDDMGIEAYLYKFPNIQAILTAFNNKNTISGKQLKDAINELKNSNTFKEVNKGKPTTNAKLVQKLVHQLELMPTNAVVQAAKVEKSKTNIFNRIFKRGDYKVAKESKNEIKKELNDVETARQDFLKEKTDIERKIKDIDKKLLTFDNKNDQHTKQLKQNLEVEKNALNTQLDTLEQTFKKTVSYKGNAILESKANEKIKGEANKIQEKINKVEKEINKLTKQLKSKNKEYSSKTNKTKYKKLNKIAIEKHNIDNKINTLNAEKTKLKNELQQKYDSMNQTLKAPKNVTKTTIIDPSINKPAKPLSTNKAARSFSITSATQINTKNLDYDNKFKSTNELFATDINNSKTVFDKALSDSKNDPKLFEKKMNNEIDKEVKDRIEFESDIENKEYKNAKTRKDITLSKRDLKELDKKHNKNLKNIKEKYNTLSKEAKTEVKAFAKEMKEVNKGMNR